MNEQTEKTESKLTLPIEIGKQYIRRDGKVVFAQYPAAGSRFLGRTDLACIWTSGDKPLQVSAPMHVWKKTGKVNHEGHQEPDSEYDLVEDYVKSSTVDYSFTPWNGGEQPAETRGKLVVVRFRDAPPWMPEGQYRADSLVWVHGLDGYKIVAYKFPSGQQETKIVGAQPEHFCAQVLRWIADGHIPQRKTDYGQWKDQSIEVTLGEIARCMYPAERYRLPPVTAEWLEYKALSGKWEFLRKDLLAEYQKYGHKIRKVIATELP